MSRSEKEPAAETKALPLDFSMLRARQAQAVSLPLNRVGLLHGPPGTGKTFTVFQMVWKMLNGGALNREHILFLTDRNSLKDQAYKSFFAYDANERVLIDKGVVAAGNHQVNDTGPCRICRPAHVASAQAASSRPRLPRSIRPCSHSCCRALRRILRVAS